MLEDNRIPSTDKLPEKQHSADSQLESISHAISSEAQLRKIIPAHPKLLDKRIQPSLDFFSREFMDQACIAILGTSISNTDMSPLIYKSSIAVVSDSQLQLDGLPSHCQLQAKQASCNASLYFMVPGIGHSLRINGTLNATNSHQYLFNIEGVYFHCARAAARSNFWNNDNEVVNNTAINKDNIIAMSPYALLKTQNKHGKTEISPRGDEAGFIKILNQDTLFMPERPGNKVAVSLRNIIECPDIELLFMVPGTPYTLNVKGQAYVSNQTDLLAQCQVNNKQPKTGIVIKVFSRSFKFDERLEESELWDKNKAIDKKDLTPFPKALSSHMNGIGLMGKATTAVVGAIVKHDMKNLY